MANFKFKRSTRSSQRGRGKNHSTNRERSHVARARHQRAKRKQEMNNRIAARYKAAVRLFWSGEAPDLETAHAMAA